VTPVEPEWAMVTVAIVDIRGFTTFADRVTAREAAAFLDEFFATVIPSVTAHHGQVLRLLGDGLLAVFDGPAHADRALAAGCALLGEVDARFGDGCSVGVGLNSGLVLLGTLGGGGFAEYGVVGDPVNVASRVQDATRDLREPLLLTEATRLLLEDEGPGLEARGVLALRGKPEPVAVHALAKGAVTLPGRLTPTTELRWQP
jgi:adenylate cyclase